jgi:hypothetical protein
MAAGHLNISAVAVAFLLFVLSSLRPEDAQKALLEDAVEMDLE